MARINTNNITLEYDTFGDQSSPPVLLIIGLGTQMIAWDESICHKIAQSGYYVIRFDNRDAGLSTMIDSAGKPDMPSFIANIMQGKKTHPPYTLDDMADDAIGLLDGLGINKAHICGMSMGGMIAQTVAIRHPERVLTLTSIYSSTGNPQLPQAKPEVAALAFSPPPEKREDFIEFKTTLYKKISGPGFPFDESWHRDLATREYDRSFYPDGVARQLIAIIAHGNRKEALKKIKIPTLIIHGSDDPLIPVEGGKDTAEAMPEAKFIIIEGMGHDVPRYRGSWAQVIDHLLKHFQSD